jgi:hypothetical protein
VFEALKQRREQMDMERRQLGYEKDSTSHQAMVNPQDDANTIGIIESRADLQRWQQMLKEDFARFYYELGYFEAKDGTFIKIDGFEQSCNVLCVTKLRTLLNPFCHRSPSITKFSTQNINQIMLDTMTTIVIDIAAHMREYEVKNTAGLAMIKNSCEAIIHPILLRSIDGFTKKEDNAARKILESANPIQNERLTMFQRLQGMM